jgi:PleD family two-component response regulator
MEVSLHPKAPKPRVLVVDDSPSNRLAMEAVLDRDYDVTSVDSGMRAVEICRHQEFAVIVLDVRMPDMDGFSTAQVLRKLDATQSTPIIIFTSAFDQSVAHVSRGFAAGATDFLFSPIEPEILKLKVETYVQIYERQRELRLKVKELSAALSELRAELATLKSKVDRVDKTFSDLDRQTQ